VLGGLCAMLSDRLRASGSEDNPFEHNSSFLFQASGEVAVSLRALSLPNVCLDTVIRSAQACKKNGTCDACAVELRGTSAASRASARCRCREQRRCK
jgi:hypothetical protein